MLFLTTSMADGCREGAPEGVLFQNPTGRATELRNETVGKQDTVLRDDSVCVIVIVETQ